MNDTSSMTVQKGAVIVQFSSSADETASRLQRLLEGAERHGPAGRRCGADILFADAGAHLRQLFAQGRPIIGLCAAGILIRLLAPALGDKRGEPPVLAMAEDGSCIIPLLGGHRGGNDLARRIARAFAVQPAITTASDLGGLFDEGVALDAPPPGWRLAAGQDVKPFAAALLAGEAVDLSEAPPFLRQGAGERTAAGAHLRIAASLSGAGSETCLIYRPQRLVLGMGCERGCDSGQMIALARAVLEEAGMAPEALAALCSVDVKMDEAAIHETAAALGVEARFFPAARLEEEAPRLSDPSEVVFAEVGCHGVAEGAALAGAGEGGELIVAKRKSARATAALALSPAPIAELPGRRRGHLFVVGIGPGHAPGMTLEARYAIARAQDLVAYSLYTDLLGDLAASKERHDFPLGAEEARVRHALDLATAGRDVALVCSGDAGIYAMASLVFELRAAADDPLWQRVAVTVVPGVSALQTAAARIGAPLGHDFCAISLSDLLTPWEAIEKRLQAAADGDFVIAFYNPVSRRRRWQLARAREILLTRRRGDTPVVLARNLGREGEHVTVTDLASLDADDVDMLTLVLVGSTATRRLVRPDGGVEVHTPRGYAAKRDGAGEQG